MGFYRTLKVGQQYLNSWPLESKLGAIFPENRVIKATLFAQKMMPFLAVLFVVWQQIYAHGDNMAFAVAVLSALFGLCLPLQGFYWLGKRSQTALSPQSAVGFHHVLEKLKEKQEVIPNFSDKPTYLDLANLLKMAQKKLPQDFWQDL